jgi:signal transduction histidine kinase
MPTAEPSEASETLALEVLPRIRMHAKLRRILLVTAIAQVCCGAIALMVLQSPWRNWWRPSQSDSLVRLIASQIAEEPLVSIHPSTQRALDRAAAIPSVRFAAIIDPDREVLRSCGALPPELASRLAAGGRVWERETPQLLYTNAGENDQVFAVALPKELGQPRALVMGIGDIAAERAALDGAICLGAVLVAAGLIQFPLVMGRFGRWTSGLHDLHTAIRRLARGVPCRPLSIAGDDEVAYLCLAFNDMSGRLLEGRRALIEANHKLEVRVRERTEELRVANSTLEKQNAALKDLTETAMRFTDDVAHEFRTPLTVVSEFASLMSDGIGGDVTEKQSEYLHFINDASKDLSGLVDDFLDSSKLRARTLRVDRRAHPVSAVLDSIWPMLDARAKRMGVGLRRVEEPLTPMVFADAEKIGRAVLNLAMNALKFSREGKEVRIECGPSDKGMVRIAVVDQGPGLTEQEIAALFERFRQTDSGRRAGAKGFGLGLSIVQDLVSLNLGQMFVTSTPGEGSTFGFELPSDDPEAVIDMLLAREHDKDFKESIGILRVGATRGALDEAARTALASVSYPLDVQLPLPDGNLLLVGTTRNVHRWRDRLLAEIETRKPGEEAIHVEVAAECSIDEAKECIRGLLAETVPVPEGAFA